MLKKKTPETKVMGQRKPMSGREEASLLENQRGHKEDHERNMAGKKLE